VCLPRDPRLKREDGCDGAQNEHNRYALRSAGAFRRRRRRLDTVRRFSASHSSSSIYQIPNTEHMAYRLVRYFVYTRGVGIRETVRVGFWFGKTK